MSSTRHNRKRRAGLSRFRIEELEARALLSLAAQPFTENVLDKSTLTFSLAPFLQESDPNATVTFSLTSTTTNDGGQIIVRPRLGPRHLHPGRQFSVAGLVLLLGLGHRQ